MGSFDNVVLTYQHPHVSIFLEDNTIQSDDTTITAVARDFNGLQVGFYDSGRDNVVLYCSTKEEFLAEYGNPNFKLYGQAGYNAYQALNTGNAGMYILRLMPEDATHANVVLMVKFKPMVASGGLATTEPDGVTPLGMTEDDEVVRLTGSFSKTGKNYMSVSFYTQIIPNATSPAELKAQFADLYETDDDGNPVVDPEDGCYHMPLMLIYQLGRGVYGQRTRLTFADPLDYTGAEEPSYRQYCLHVMEPTKTGLSVKEYIYGCLNEDKFDADVEYGPSLYMKDVTNDPEDGSQKIGMDINTATIEKIVEVYNSVSMVYGAEEATVDDIDIIFGKTLAGDVDPYIEFDADSLNIASTDGFQLGGGSDGLFSQSNPNIEDDREELLLKAFRGEVDRLIKSRYSTPVDFCLDANFPNEVKKQMVLFAQGRQYDCMTYLDSGLNQTSNDVINWLTEMKHVYSYNVLKEVGCFKYRDKEFTGKLIPVTITHWLAKALPLHMLTPGLSEPFARETARLVAKEDYVNGSFLPIIDPDDNDIKMQIYKLRGNCYETVNYSSFQRSSGITTCQEVSDRLEEFNEYILNKAVKLAYALLEEKLYKLGEESERAAYQEHANKEMNYQLSPYLKSVSVEFVMSSADEKRNILRLKLRLSFRTIVKYGILEVYLDPRVTTTN